MFFNVLLLDITFKLSLFGLLIYKLYDLARSTVLPFLNEQFILEKKYQTELLNKEKLLFSSQQRVKNQILSQKQLFILLERNVQTWNAAKQEEYHAQEKENKEIVLQTQDRRHIQNNHLELLINTQSSLPAALHQATQALREQYASVAGRERLINLIDQLKSTATHTQKKKV